MLTNPNIIYLKYRFRQKNFLFQAMTNIILKKTSITKPYNTNKQIIVINRRNPGGRVPQLLTFLEFLMFLTYECHFGLASNVKQWGFSFCVPSGEIASLHTFSTYAIYLFLRFSYECARFKLIEMQMSLLQSLVTQLQSLQP